MTGVSDTTFNINLLARLLASNCASRFDKYPLRSR
jgi:hypothetical protein